MLIPYKDMNPTRRVPVVTIVLIIINVALFSYAAFVSDGGFQRITRNFALIPAAVSKGKLPGLNLLNPYITLLTYMFFHANIPHLLFNMLFLWIFGNNVEDAMTRTGYLIFYLAIGVASGLVYVASNPDSGVSLVGASGAISGILGAYLFLYPSAKVKALLLIFPVKMPAIIFLLLWFFMQISGYLGPGTNIAWESHISGFIVGMMFFRLFLRRK